MNKYFYAISAKINVLWIPAGIYPHVNGRQESS